MYLSVLYAKELKTGRLIVFISRVSLLICFFRLMLGKVWCPRLPMIHTTLHSSSPETLEKNKTNTN
jgi:hypothetical protein